jgi:general secretion pathway protein G
MFELIRKARENEEGFTLIELLMVIVILGVLAGVVVFAVNGIQDKGQNSACQADYSTITTAEEAYFAQPPGGGTPAYTATVQDLVDAGFLHSDPGTVSVTVTGNTYTVAGIGACTAYQPN